jgi:hypothetical protein
MYCGPRHGIRPIDHHTKSISSNKHSRRTKTKKHKKKTKQKTKQKQKAEFEPEAPRRTCIGEASRPSRTQYSDSTGCASAPSPWSTSIVNMPCSYQIRLFDAQSLQKSFLLLDNDRVFERHEQMANPSYKSTVTLENNFQDSLAYFRGVKRCEYLTSVKLHVFVKVARREHFADRCNELLQQQMFDVVDAVRMA